MLAAPADARPHREFDLHDRRGISEGAMAEGPDFGFDAVAEFLQAAAHHLVVVPAARIASDVRMRRFPQLVLDASGNVLQVVHAAGKHSHGAGNEVGRLRAERGMPSHIIHLAVPSHSKPFGEAAAGGGEVDVGDADGLEAELDAPLLDLIRERSHVRES